MEAQAEARELRHAYLGTEHLLLGILHQTDREAVRSLAERGVDVQTVRPRVAAIVGFGEAEVSGQVPFTPRVKTTLELAMRECISHGNERVAPEHLLLGLLGEREGVAAGVLTELGIELDALRAEIVACLPPPGAVVREARGRVRAAGPPVPMASGFDVQLSPEVRRLLMSAAARALDDGRTEIEIADVEEALRRRRKPGEPGDPPAEATA